MPKVRYVLVATLVLTVLTGCADPRACTLRGSRPGIGVAIDPAVAGRVSAAELTVCWDRACRTPPITLLPSSESVDDGCQDGVCSAHQEPTGGKHGFAAIPDLPARPVKVTLSLTGPEGSTVVEQALTVTPVLSYPNGPDCGTDGSASAGITVNADATVRSTG